MSNTAGLTVALVPNDVLKIGLKMGESATSSISVTNTNEQKIIVKLRSNAGKKLHIKKGILLLDSNETAQLEVKLSQKSVDEIMQKVEEAPGRVVESYRLQFNIAGISDVLFDHLRTIEQDQDKFLSEQWNLIKKNEIQQYVVAVNCINNSSSSSSVLEERKSEESLSSLTITDIVMAPEYKQLRTKYEAICVVVKRCQDIIQKQQNEKKDLEKKLEETQSSQQSSRIKEIDKVISDGIISNVKTSTITSISVFGFILAFVIGFVLGQFASRFMK